jgi:hypothetical protein
MSLPRRLLLLYLRDLRILAIKCDMITLSFVLNICVFVLQGRELILELDVSDRSRRLHWSDLGEGLVFGVFWLVRVVLRGFLIRRLTS